MREPPRGCDPDSIILSFPVAREHAGVRLDRFIQSRIPRLSRTRAQAIVKACAYGGDGRKRRASQRVRHGETVYIVRPPMDEPDVPLHYGVLHDDAHLLVIDKPAGLPMHPTASYHRNTLLHVLQTKYPEGFAPMFAHRLDRETSGVVVCGKSSEAEVSLKKAFQNRKVDKSYLAIVHGVLEGEGRIDLRMAPVREGLHILMEIREDGAKAVTEYRALEHRAGLTMVALHPTSGRQHQLRVHMAALGHPIVGDKLYGAEGHAPFMEMIDTGPTDELLRRLVHPRQALHAHRLVVPHPRDGSPIPFEAPLAWDLALLWAAAGDALAGRPAVSFEALLSPPDAETVAHLARP